MSKEFCTLQAEHFLNLAIRGEGQGIWTSQEEEELLLLAEQWEEAALFGGDPPHISGLTPFMWE